MFSCSGLRKVAIFLRLKSGTGLENRSFSSISHEEPKKGLLGSTAISNEFWMEDNILGSIKPLKLNNWAEYQDRVSKRDSPGKKNGRLVTLALLKA